MVLVPEVLFMAKLRGGGDLMLEAPELMLTLEVLIEGLPEAFGAFSLRENRPILDDLGAVLGGRASKDSDGVGSVGGVEARPSAESNQRDNFDLLTKTCSDGYRRRGCSLGGD